MSSSNRIAVPADGAVFRDDTPVGPIRLPVKEPSSFIVEFNRIYGKTGMRLKWQVKSGEPSDTMTAPRANGTPGNRPST